MKTEKELDFLETLIPGLAGSATKKAYLEALSNGISVTEVIDGKIFRTSPDGTKTFVKKVAGMVEVKTRHTAARNSVL